VQHRQRKASVFEAANIREWRGHDVVDCGDHKLGELEAVYVDTSTDLPSFGTVKVGMPTRHRLVFVPLDQATVGPEYLKVSYARKQVKDARRSAPTASCQRAAKRRSLSTTAWHISRAPAVSGGWPAAEQPPERRTR
jgi:PRC-barrel domain protein